MTPQQHRKPSNERKDLIYDKSRSIHSCRDRFRPVEPLWALVLKPGELPPGGGGMRRVQRVRRHDRAGEEKHTQVQSVMAR
uniref:Uncharacterized protein n=1 Tax=Endocarpon pusillum TaxID=364733 RepID=F8QWZ9_9EURO|nr:unknown protein [Endocarpon pusillum]